MIIRSDLDGISDVCKYIASQKPKIILLKGNLASGKTTLVQEFAKYLKLDVNASSPTFSILNIYDESLYHYDIYNSGTKKFLELGLLQNLENGKYHFIEWADEDLAKILSDFGLEYILVNIDSQSQERIYDVSTY